MTHMEWRSAILERLGPRQSLDRESAIRDLWLPLGIPRVVVEEVLDMLELEYSIPGAHFRPEDRLAALLTPVAVSGMFARSTNAIRAGDRQLELGAYLERRRRQIEAPMPRDLETLGQFAHACNGGP